MLGGDRADLAGQLGELELHLAVGVLVGELGVLGVQLVQDLDPIVLLARRSVLLLQDSDAREDQIGVCFGGERQVRAALAARRGGLRLGRLARRSADGGVRCSTFGALGGCSDAHSSTTNSSGYWKGSVLGDAVVSINCRIRTAGSMVLQLWSMPRMRECSLLTAASTSCPNSIRCILTRVRRASSICCILWAVRRTPRCAYVKEDGQILGVKDPLLVGEGARLQRVLFLGGEGVARLGDVVVPEALHRGLGRVDVVVGALEHDARVVDGLDGGVAGTLRALKHSEALFPAGAHAAHLGERLAALALVLARRHPHPVEEGALHLLEELHVCSDRAVCTVQQIGHASRRLVVRAWPYPRSCGCVGAKRRASFCSPRAYASESAARRCM